MASAVDVSNFALSRIGISDRINDLNEGTTRAKVCSLWLPQCRDEVLRDFAWGFAAKTEQLALVLDQSVAGWSFVYQYPNTAVRIIGVGEQNYVTGLQQGIGGLRYSPYYDEWPSYKAPWEVALKADGASRVLLSSVQSAWVSYVAQVSNLGVWPADAISTLAWKLAAEIGGTLKADENKVRAAIQAYEFQRQRAAANSQNESRSGPKPESVSITARY